MKRTISIFLALLMLFSLAACGEQAKEEDPPAASTQTSDGESNENVQGKVFVDFQYMRIYPDTFRYNDWYESDTDVTEEEMTFVAAKWLRTPEDALALQETLTAYLTNELNFMVENADRGDPVHVKRALEWYGAAVAVLQRCTEEYLQEHTVIAVNASCLIENTVAYTVCNGDETKLNIDYTSPSGWVSDGSATMTYIYVLEGDLPIDHVEDIVFNGGQNVYWP